VSAAPVLRSLSLELDLVSPRFGERTGSGFLALRQVLRPCGTGRFFDK